MLRKLIKYEMQATSKAMLPILGGILVLAIAMRFGVIPILETAQRGFAAGLATVFTFLFSASIMALSFAPLIVSGSRFKKSVLGNEGYLTMTLPVTSHEILISKIIVNAIWYTATGIIYVLIFIVLVSKFDTLNIPEDFFMGLFDTARRIDADDAKAILNVALIAFEIFMCLIAGAGLADISVFTSYAMGYSAKKRKSLCTVLLLYALFHLDLYSLIAVLFNVGRNDMRMQSGFIAGSHMLESILFVFLLIIIGISAVLYFVTNYFITRKLNLE